jgi:hypothetical protein
MTEDEIIQAHKDRVAVLLDTYGDKFKIPQADIMKLQEQNKQDWVDHIAERDGRRSRVAAAPAAPKPRLAEGTVEDAERAFAAFTGHRIDPDDPRIGKA